MIYLLHAPRLHDKPPSSSRSFIQMTPFIYQHTLPLMSLLLSFRFASHTAHGAFALCQADFITLQVLTHTVRLANTAEVSWTYVYKYSRQP